MRFRSIYLAASIICGLRKTGPSNTDVPGRGVGVNKPSCLRSCSIGGNSRSGRSSRSNRAGAVAEQKPHLQPSPSHQFHSLR